MSGRPLLIALLLHGLVGLFELSRPCPVGPVTRPGPLADASHCECGPLTAEGPGRHEAPGLLSDDDETIPLICQRGTSSREQERGLKDSHEVVVRGEAAPLADSAAAREARPRARPLFPPLSAQVLFCTWLN